MLVCFVHSCILFTIVSPNSQGSFRHVIGIIIAFQKCTHLFSYLWYMRVIIYSTFISGSFLVDEFKITYHGNLLILHRIIYIMEKNHAVDYLLLGVGLYSICCYLVQSYLAVLKAVILDRILVMIRTLCQLLGQKHQKIKEYLNGYFLNL